MMIADGRRAAEVARDRLLCSGSAMKRIVDRFVVQFMGVAGAQGERHKQKEHH